MNRNRENVASTCERTSRAELSAAQRTESSGGRWIRPVAPASTARCSSGDAARPSDDVSAVAWDSIRSVRARLAELSRRERRLEDEIRRRWRRLAGKAWRRRAEAEAELRLRRAELEDENERRRERAEREGEARGFEAGFERGREEGRRVGAEAGRRAGREEGEREGRERGAKESRAEFERAASSLRAAAAALGERREQLVADARGSLLELAVAIARKIIRARVDVDPELVGRTVAAAAELVVRSRAVTVQVHPDDARFVERELGARPPWAEGFASVEVRASTGVDRGGCRLVTDVSSLDLRIEAQLSQIATAMARVYGVERMESPSLDRKVPCADI